MMTFGRLLRRALVVTLAALLSNGAAAAQTSGADDSAAEAEVLRQRIEERFSARLTQELNLTDDQARQLRETSRTYARRRRQLYLDERQYKLALERQMRPGMAADQDSVARLTDRLSETRIALSHVNEEEIASMTYLSPVQRARYLQLRERLMDRVRDARIRRQEQLRRRDRPLRRGMPR